MAATRQKAGAALDVGRDAMSHAPSTDDAEAVLLDALGPLSDASNKSNVQLNPSTHSRPGSSPSKKTSSPLRPRSSQQLVDFRLSPPRHTPTFPTDSPTKDGGFYAMYQQVAPKLDRSLYPQYPTIQDKENASYQGASFGTMTMPPCHEVDYGYKGPLKRGLMESAPLKPSVKKQKTSSEDESESDLPRPEDLPSLADDGQKPPHSYAELIGMAILRSPNRRLTLAQIYKWISDNFTFYRGSEGGWQNSIRHNLSLNKNFIKQERPKDDPGKGNYWAIQPGQERPFLLGRKQPMRKMPDGSSYTHGLPLPATSDPVNYRQGSTPAIGNFSLGPLSSRKSESKDIDSAKFPDEADLSSDGTIPASDPALQEDERDEDAVAMPPPAVHLRSSPPPLADLGSSPPTFDAHRNGTPPLDVRQRPSSRSGGRRRKHGGLGDSGYWSSIESSAARGAAHALASETDIRSHRMKKGRAEAEIARIRSSSFDSPIKDQHRYHGLPSNFGSSPSHKDDNPLTPAVIFKRPARPIPAASPNTNLQDHRNRVRALLGSPAKTFSPMPDANTWSPAFTLSEEGPVGLTPFISPYKASKTPWRPVADSPSAAYNLNNAAFDIFIDQPHEDIAARGSPEKRANRRPSLVRAATSTGILADITGTAKSNNALTLPPTNNSPFSMSPFLSKSSTLRSPAKFSIGSPLKQSHEPPATSAHDDTKWMDAGTGAENRPAQSMSNKDVADLFGVELNSDGSEEAIDLFQDFGKIGQSAPMAAPDRSTGSPVRKSAMGPPARPALGRSATSRW